MNRKTLLYGVLVAFSLAGCKSKDVDVLSKIDENIFYVKTQKVVIKDLSNEIVLSGMIKAMDEAIIYPRTTGKLVRNVLKEGDSVKKDEVIAYIKRDEVGVVYEPAPVPSTLDGIIGRIYQDVGADVNPQTPIALVVNQENVRVQIDVPEKYISNLKYGKTVKVKVDAYNKVFVGKIEKISPVVDKLSKTVLVEAVIDNQGGELKSGMFCQASIVVDEVKGAKAIPVASVIYKDNNPYVYILDETKTKAVEKKAILGIKTEDFVEIKNLNKDDDVIYVGLYGIKDGANIRLVE